MILLDGGNFLSQNGGSKVLDVVDNLIYLKKIPMMLLVFLDPGTIDESAKGPAVDRIREYAQSTHRTPNQATRSIPRRRSE